MDKEKKQFHFNWVDVIIILVVIAAAAGALLVKNMVFKEEKTDTYPIRFTVEARNMFPVFSEVLTVGDEIFDSSTDIYVGKIVDIEALPHEKNFKDSFTSTLKYTSDNAEDLSITIEGDGYAEGSNIYIGSYLAKVGNTFFVKNKGYAFPSFVQSIDTMGIDLPELASSGKGDLEITYQIINLGVRQATVDAVKPGDPIFDGLTDAFMGTVLETEAEAIKDDNGNTTGYYNLIVTLKGNAVETDMSYFLDGELDLKVGTGSLGNADDKVYMYSRDVRTSYAFYSILDVK